MSINLKDRFRTSLKYFRFLNKLSQEQVAEKADVSNKYISDLENGKSCPSLQTIENIAKVFNIDPLELLTDKYYKEYATNNKKIDEIRGRLSHKK